METPSFRKVSYEAMRIPILSLLTAILLFNMSQRRHLAHGERKRFATLKAAGLVLLLAVEFYLIDRANMSAWFALPAIGFALVAAYTMRETLLIFKLHCVVCDRALPLVRTLYYDDNLCPACALSHATLAASANSAQFPHGVPRSVDEIDWNALQSDEQAVLCFVRRGDEILLIEKKTGLGAGKINAPGGRIEAGESAEDASIRETEEEVRVTPAGVEKRVDLSFVFTNGYSLHGSVFFADSFAGTPSATSEADPFWCQLSEIPYARMWEDDAEWLPRALEGRRLAGKFIFDGDRMISKRVEELD